MQLREYVSQVLIRGVAKVGMAKWHIHCKTQTLNRETGPPKHKLKALFKSNSLSPERRTQNRERERETEREIQKERHAEIERERETERQSQRGKDE